MFEDCNLLNFILKWAEICIHVPLRHKLKTFFGKYLWGIMKSIGWEFWQKSGLFNLINLFFLNLRKIPG